MYPDRLNLDVLQDGVTAEEIKQPERVKREYPSGVDPRIEQVYNLFGDEPLHPDEICAATGLPLSKVIAVLMQLELEEYIEQTEGKNYILK